MERLQPKLPQRRPVRSSNLATGIAFGGVFGAACLLLGLTAIVLPNVVGITAVVFGTAAFGLLHYLTWGRWLINRRRRLHDDD